MPKMEYTIAIKDERHLRVFYCNDCGDPYLTDNDGSRKIICDYCRAEMGDHMRGKAIEEPSSSI